jgi:hypothetical protein
MSNLSSTTIVEKYYEENKNKLVIDVETLFVAIEHKLIEIISCGIYGADLKTIDSFYEESCKCERDGAYWKCSIYINDRYNSLPTGLIGSALKFRYGAESKLLLRGESYSRYDNNNSYIEIYILVPNYKFQTLLEKAKIEYLDDLRQKLDKKIKELDNIMDDPIIKRRIKTIKGDVDDLREKINRLNQS